MFFCFFFVFLLQSQKHEQVSKHSANPFTQVHGLIETAHFRNRTQEKKNNLVSQSAIQKQSLFTQIHWKQM